jgi:hypothetical protein
VTVSCPACAAPAQIEDVYCGECGNRLAKKDPAEPPIEGTVSGDHSSVAPQTGEKIESPMDAVPDPPNRTTGVEALDKDVAADDKEDVTRRPIASVATLGSFSAGLRPAGFPLLELSPVECMFSPLSGSAGEDVARVEILAGRVPS